VEEIFPYVFNVADSLLCTGVTLMILLSFFPRRRRTNRSLPPMPSDADFMHRAIELAMRGRGHVEPNPMVGCVVVKDGRVIAEDTTRNSAVRTPKQMP